MKPNQWTTLLAVGILAAVHLAAASKPVNPGPLLKDDAWEHYISSRKRFHVALHHLIGLRWEELKPVLKKSLKLKLTAAEMESRRYYYLLANEPGRIRRDQGYPGFVSLDWRPSDESRLLKYDGKYDELNDELTMLGKELNLDPYYPEIEEKLLLLENDREYLEIKARFRFVGHQVEKMLAAEQKIT